jgi:hypothetical protein
VKVRAIGSGLALLLAMSGCRHVPADTGVSSFEVVKPPPPRVTVETPDQKPVAASNMIDFREAEPIRPLVMPVYPAAALKAKAGRAQVGVRVNVEASGRVGDIAASMLAASTPGPFAPAFRDAVEAAVRQWRFRPAQIIEQEEAPLPGGGSYKRVTHRESTEAQFDLVFTFTETGKVEAGK